MSILGMMSGAEVEADGVGRQENSSRLVAWKNIAIAYHRNKSSFLINRFVRDGLGRAATDSKINWRVILPAVYVLRFIKCQVP